MPSLAMYRISPPSDPYEFEKICMDYLAHKFDADIQLYGRKGQSQQGIDLLLTLKDNSYNCAQCKNYKNVTTHNLDSWISKADEECKIPMNVFIILVAIENDSRLQEHICKVSAKRLTDGKFPVRIIFWDDVIHYIKRDQTMLRLYYPEFYQGQEVIINEAVIPPEEKFPARIISSARLRSLFFDEAVKYRIEEFLCSDPKAGVSIDLVGYSDACIYSIKKLLYRAPMLSAEDCFYDIEQFLNSFSVYCGFLPNTTETCGNKIIAINKYGTEEEKDNLEHCDELRNSALEDYNQLKNF